MGERRADIAACKSVLADLEKASGADRELGARIICALLAPEGSKVEKSPRNGEWCIYEPNRYRPDEWMVWSAPDPFRRDYFCPTESLDATIALVERVLPGWAREVSFWGSTARSSLWECDPEGWHSSRGIKTSAASKSEPIALLTAMFRAKIAQMEKAG